MKYFCITILALFTLTASARAAEVMPPKPPKYFNDFTNTVPASTAAELNAKLDAFDKQTSNQVVVVVYPRMQSDSSIEDYTVRVAQSWGAGQKDRKNGVVLFVFKNDRKMYISVGYGLEGALPDILAKQIIENEITPSFKTGDFAGGLRKGIDAIMAATKGEYKALPARQENPASGFVVFLIFLAVIWIVSAIARRAARSTYSRGGRSSGLWPLIVMHGMSRGGGWSSGGSWGGGGGGGGFSGGGFSGGGGSFGGGGAGGSW